MAKMGMKWNSWSGKIETKDQAAKAVKEIAIAFFVIAGIQIAASFVLGFDLLIDASIYTVLAILLITLKSRAVAVILCLMTLLSFAVTIMNLFGAKPSGGNNLWLAVVVVYAGIRAVQATFVFRKLKNVPPIQAEPVMEITDPPQAEK